MNIESLREFCLAFPHVTESLPFGPGTLVFKVGDKIFLLLSLDSPGIGFNVKCDPEIAESLREKYPGIVKPGYHMNKKHWNTVSTDERFPEHLLKQWISDSYFLVYNSLPAKVRGSL